MDEIESLSGQQRRCLEGVLRGLTGAQIAYELGIAESTVIGHLNEARRKLNAPNRRLAAYKYGVAIGLLEAKPTPAAAEPPPQQQTGHIQPVAFEQLPPLPDVPDRVFEERSTFGMHEIHELRVDSAARTMPPLKAVTLIVLIAAGLVILLLALDPLTRSAAALANSIQPPFM